MEEELLHLIALSMIENVGPVTARNLIAKCGSAQSVLKAKRRDLLETTGIGLKIAKSVLEAQTLKAAEAELEFCRRRQIEVLAYNQESYPSQLSQIYDSPLILFKKGNIELNAAPGIAIVGTRKPTNYGIEITKLFASAFASLGINVISGLALGIDTEAHKSALGSGGLTTGILGHGLDRIYPSENRALAGQIVGQGALLTEFRRGSDPEKNNFPARNRIISGLSLAVIVIEAASKGGALITAGMALDHDRLVFAVPGPIGAEFSTGCNQLIRDNVAKLVTSPEEVLEDLKPRLIPYVGGIPVKPKVVVQHQVPLSFPERKILDLLQKGDRQVDDLSNELEMKINPLLSLLLQMEFKGLVRSMPGKRYGV